MLHWKRTYSSRSLQAPKKLPLYTAPKASTTPIEPHFTNTSKPKNRHLVQTPHTWLDRRRCRRLSVYILVAWRELHRHNPSCCPFSSLRDLIASGSFGERGNLRAFSCRARLRRAFSTLRCRSVSNCAVSHTTVQGAFGFVAGVGERARWSLSSRERASVCVAHVANWTSVYGCVSFFIR